MNYKKTEYPELIAALREAKENKTNNNVLEFLDVDSLVIYERILFITFRDASCCANGFTQTRKYSNINLDIFTPSKHDTFLNAAALLVEIAKKQGVHIDEVWLSLDGDNE